MTNILKLTISGLILFIFGIDIYASTIFYVNHTEDIPAEEYISFEGFFRGFPDFYASYPMIKISDKTWMIKIDYLKKGDSISYRYGRNSDTIYGEALEDVDESCCNYRKLLITEDDQVVIDNVSDWRWYNPKIRESFSLNQESYRQYEPEDLTSNFMTGVQLPDLWGRNMLDSMPATLERIKKVVNANWVQYTPVPHFTALDPYPELDIFNRGNPTPDSDLRKIITTAKINKLNVYLRPLVWVASKENNAQEPVYPPENQRDEAWWEKYFNEIEPIYLYYAHVADELNVEILGFDPIYEQWKLKSSDIQIANKFISSLLIKIREIYAGKIATQFQGYSTDLDIFSEVDYLSAKLWESVLSTDGSKDISVDRMREIFADKLDSEFRGASLKYNKPIIINELASSSYYGGVLNTPSWDSQAAWMPDNSSVILDLQVQADVYEAALSVLSQRNWIAGAFSFSYGYASSTDKTPSIRGKPSEQVLAKWYSWLNKDSSLENATALPPYNFSAQVIKNTAYFSWQNNLDSESVTIYYGVHPGEYIGQLNLEKTDHLEISDAPKGLYYLALKSNYADLSESNLSEEISLAIDHSYTSPPTDFNAIYLDGQLYLTWKPSANASAYNIYYGVNASDFLGSFQANDVWGQSITYKMSFSGIQSGIYYIALTAVNSGGIESVLSESIKVIID